MTDKLVLREPAIAVPSLADVRAAIRVLFEPGQIVELRGLGVGVVNGGIDLRGGEIAPRQQFRSFQLHDRLSGPQFIALLREELFHAASRPRTDMHFINFYGARNRIAPLATARH